MEDGSELLSAHVSSLRFDSPPDGAEVLRSAFKVAQKEGVPAIFTAMPPGAWQIIQGHLFDMHVDEAPAAIFGHDMPAGCDWWVDTAEI